MKLFKKKEKTKYNAYNYDILKMIVDGIFHELASQSGFIKKSESCGNSNDSFCYNVKFKDSEKERFVSIRLVKIYGYNEYTLLDLSVEIRNAFETLEKEYKDLLFKKSKEN